MSSKKSVRFVRAMLTIFAFFWASVGVHAEPPKVAGFAAPGTAGEIYWQKFEDAVATLSSGRLGATLMVGGEAGPEETQFSGLRRNRLQLAGISTGTLGLAVPELAVLRAPFLFESIEEASYVLDEHLLESVTHRFAEKDLVLISWMMDGWMDLYATFPIREPGDLRARQMRVSADDSALLFMAALGADVIQIPLSDVIPGMQTGLVEGGEQSTQIFALAGLDAVANHFALTHHSYSTAGVVANKTWWDSLSDDDRMVYRNAVPNAQWYRGLVLERNALYLDRAIQSGLNVVYPTAVEQASWQNIGQRIHSDLIEEIGGDAAGLYAEIMKAKEAYVLQSAGQR
ncbi:MAG: TRAP transporter substrate-binding protein [Rhodospirillaceae bacterium]|jgi:TRAP-type transport system periplasmic protein|nr:TRAP transporter substrate-binding protein [Rhodospirillaceae bacterium]MBT5239265.1 TRAP transporter substrate-binding protein [Rhodospirillaceae bacterium]MBT5566131.1 TRAP transporter substrate-binding protein [Rhodospirillaceae bacterium]MBT6090612.1 TRAP transporter substrate-binding protein [Rhodospirillaceae bacterium]MBT6961184.1 TRAP transporter substrate-binding protein [Rhodospirillaceae bacterium]